ncbi:MAG: phospholipase D-like domain-containing protein [Dokdonella sp.]
MGASTARYGWTALAAVGIATAVTIVLAMNFVTPEKRVERKLEHRYSVSDPQFRREMSVLLGPAIIGGNHVTALQNGDEIFPAMLAAIRAAKRTITFETYIYWSGETGATFSAALAEMARAGVSVNVTVDWLGSAKMDTQLLEEMKRAGVKLHRYRPLSWYELGRLNNRTHRKLLVVDGIVGFTGGVGIADQWQGKGNDPEHWRDMHFRVEGPVVAQLQSAFNDNWIKMTGEILNGSEHFPSITPQGAMDAQLFLASPAGGSESMALMYLMTIAAASSSIDLAASYFVPDELALAALLAARDRGVRVRILVPGEHIDSEVVRLRSRAMWGDLLRAGVEISEYEPTMMHTKMLIVDSLLVSVGSTNFDERSFRLNDEASLNVYDVEFAKDMTEVFENDLKRSQRLSLQAWTERPWTERIGEWLALPLSSQL